MPWPTSPVVGQVYNNYNSQWLYNSDGTYSKVINITTGTTALLLVRTVSQLVNAVADAQLVFRVLDAPEGEVIAYSDGTTYRRVLDNSPVI